MSEKETDNASEDNNNPEIIESELDHTQESQKQETDQIDENQVLDLQDQNDIKPVIIKKGGFFTFISLLFSLAALAGTAYIFYFYHWQKIDSTENEKPWISSINTIDQKLKEQNINLVKQLTAVKNNNKKLKAEIDLIKQQAESQPALPVATTAYDDSSIQQQLQALKSQMAAQSTDTSNVKAYDDAVLKQEIEKIANQLAEQRQQYQNLKNSIDKDLQQKENKFKQMLQQFESKQAQQTVENDSQVRTTHYYELIESSLTSAQIQLNINGNMSKAQNFLNMAQQQLKKTEQPAFDALTKELEQVSQTIATIKTPDETGLKQQINDLNKKTVALTFIQNKDKKNSEEDTSWYDKLITIRKIDEQQSQLTAGEQENIRSEIKSHYGLLKMALLNKNQQLWSSQIAEISSLSKKYFIGHESIVTELMSLQKIQLNPTLPDLSVYVDKFNTIVAENAKGE